MIYLFITKPLIESAAEIYLLQKIQVAIMLLLEQLFSCFFLPFANLKIFFNDKYTENVKLCSDFCST